MAAQPLTHHEIFALVAPYARAGRHVDLAASDRIARRLAFRPVEHGAGADALRETLVLDQPDGDAWRLTRTLAHPCGLQAALWTEDDDAGAPFARIAAVAPGRQFSAGDGYVVARSYRLDADGALVLRRAEARVAGLTLALNAQVGRGMPAELELRVDEGDPIALPEDLLAVLGWDWRPLARFKGGWRGALRIPASEPERTRTAEARLERTVAHLAHTLAEPPARFHERLWRARWGVAFRRAIPLLVVLALLAAAPAVPLLDLDDDSVFRMLIFHSPPLLLLLFFSFKEIPRIELPPLPRRLRGESWRGPPRAER